MYAQLLDVANRKQYSAKPRVRVKPRPRPTTDMIIAAFKKHGEMTTAMLVERSSLGTRTTNSIVQKLVDSGELVARPRMSDRRWLLVNWYHLRAED